MNVTVKYNLSQAGQKAALIAGKTATAVVTEGGVCIREGWRGMRGGTFPSLETVRALIANAERDLGRTISFGERSDLLMDNYAVMNTDEAHRLVQEADVADSVHAAVLAEADLTLSSACFVGQHGDCTDVAGICCDCSCHLGQEPSDAVKRCPDCETPNQFGELCEGCRREADLDR